MGEIEYSPDIPGSIAWLEREVKHHEFGEIQLTVQIHDGKVAFIHRTATEKVKTTGYTGGRYDGKS